MSTYSGRRLDLKSPRPEDINLEDISVALSGMVRFTGHAMSYTVAHHCLAGVKVIERLGLGDEATRDELKLNFLLHDAHEAYTGDISTPLKNLIGRKRIRKIERRIQAAIRESMRLPPVPQVQEKIIKAVDESLLVAEHNFHLDLASPLSSVYGSDREPPFTVLPVEISSHLINAQALRHLVTALLATYRTSGASASFS